MYYNLSVDKKSKSKSKKPADNQPIDKKALIVTIAVLMFSTLAAFGSTKLIEFLNPTPEPEVADDSVIDINAELNLAFLRLESNKQNLIYSPLSIKNGLSLLNAGADGVTKAQIEKVLGDDVMLDRDASNSSDKLSLANGVFIRDTFKDNILKVYAKTIEKGYNAEIIYDSFSSSKTMDDWVSDKTFHLVDKLGFTPRDNTELVLINALALKLDWLYPFESSHTSGRDFFTADNQTIAATTLNMTTSSSDIYYYQDNSATLVTLPLESVKDAKLEFVALMPSGDLANYIRNLNLATIDSYITSATPANTTKDGIELYIPKFNFDYELKFKNDLMRLGITDAFSENLADFSKMSSEPLYVSDAIHKSNIDFSEKGIKAAAVTSFAMNVSSVMPGTGPQPLVLKFDRPFLFLIRDKGNGTIWFVGTVYRPNLWSDDAKEYLTQSF